MSFEKVNVVDDDALVRRMLTDFFRSREIPVATFGTGADFLREHQREPSSLVVLDLKLPDANGLDLLRTARQASRDSRCPTEFIIVTGFGTIESAVEAMKLGATSYLLKPFTISQFELALNQVAEQKRLRSENTYLKEQVADSGLAELLCCSPQMKSICSLIDRVAPTPATVLLQGESGTGKEVVARLIHQRSSRRQKPYIKVNCAAVPENLLESEFFGHEKGAFTGATSRREGRFELAHEGTLLLDEVTEISLGLQSKLLRVLQEQEFERVGGNRTIKVDVRVIATTNKNLQEAVDRGQFRRDLFFRLNVVPIKIPALRERRGDVEFLLDHFVQFFSRKHGRSKPRVGAMALQQLVAYPWIGNVRELQNCVERAMILCGDRDELHFGDFMMAPSSPTEAVFDLQRGFPTIEEVERRLIDLALKETKGNRSKAAELLGINVRTLRNKLSQYATAKDAFPDTEEDKASSPPQPLPFCAEAAGVAGHPAAL